MDITMNRCNICGGAMTTIQEGHSYKFIRCKKCHWYSTIKKIPGDTFDYNDYETFDADEAKFDVYVEKAAKMLETKFALSSFVPQRFLDIGCSEGPFLKAAIDRFGIIATGIEVSDNKRIRARDKGLNVVTYEDDIGKYDFVLLRHVIEHIEKPREFISMVMTRYVSKEGVLFIETPNNESLVNTIKGNRLRDDRFCRGLYPPTHVCGFSPRAFRYLDDWNIKAIGTSNMNDDRWGYEGTDCRNWPRSKRLRQSMRRRLDLDADVYVVLMHKR